MVNGIGPTGGSGRADGARAVATQKATVAGKIDEARPSDVDAPSNPVADLVASGPPVDAAKIAEIRAAIAAGAYRLDVQAIAERMIALDLPRGS
jgi:negative regulator of flagellin synthesis FlgM